MDLVNLSSNIGLLGFALASVLYLMAVQRNNARPWAAKSAFGSFSIATAAVTTALFATYKDSSFTDISGLFLAAMIGWFAIFADLRFKLKLIGTFVAPLATFILLIQFFLVPVRGSGVGATTASTSFLKLHITLAIVGMAFAIIACAISILYLWQQQLLKKKLLDQIPTNLPAMDRLDKLLMTSLWCGFGFITLGLISGAVMVQSYAHAGQGIDAKVLWAILVWVWYLATLLARNVFNRPSKRLAQMSLIGVLLLAITYFGMGFFRPLGGG